MRNTPERHQQLGEFFTANHDRLHRAVTRYINSRPELIDDACTDAWTILLRRPDITLDQRGFRWLLTVAIHEALRLLRRTRGETPVGTLQADSRGHDGQDEPEPIDAETSAADDRALELLAHAERAQLFRELKQREREALYLHALGYSYHEICDLSGARGVIAACGAVTHGNDMSLRGSAASGVSSPACRRRGGRAAERWFRRGRSLSRPPFLLVVGNPPRICRPARLERGRQKHSMGGERLPHQQEQR